jgi:hypothetical protein
MKYVTTSLLTTYRSHFYSVCCIRKLENTKMYLIHLLKVRLVIQPGQRLANSWVVRGSNFGGGEISRTRQNRPWSPTSLLYKGYRVSYSVVKWLGRGIDHPPASSTEVKGRVELYVCSLSGPSWPVLG